MAAKLAKAWDKPRKQTGNSLPNHPDLIPTWAEPPPFQIRFVFGAQVAHPPGLKGLVLGGGFRTSLTCGRRRNDLWQYLVLSTLVIVACIRDWR